jgi:DNA-binding transcriptional LysR family regulator
MQLPNQPDLSARDLAAVIAVADHKSFIAASALLKVSQPTLSRTVKRVEQVIGVPLFARTSRRVKITPAGREFVAVAERILNDLHLTLRNLGAVAAEQRGQVIVSTFPIFAHRTLPEIVRRYRETRQHVEVHLREGRYPDVLEDVVSGVADFGITYVDVLPGEVQGVPLRSEPLNVVLPAGHALAARAPAIALQELEGWPLVSLPRESHTRRLVDDAASKAGIGLLHAVTVPGFRDVISQITAGVGVGIVPHGVLPDPLPRELVSRPLTAPALRMAVRLITLRSRQLSPAASSFMALTLEMMCDRAAEG